MPEQVAQNPPSLLPPLLPPVAFYAAPRPPLVPYSPLHPSPEDIILSCSSDYDSEDTRKRKRARREQCGRDYLQGRPRRLISATLRGPFENGWKNPWARPQRAKHRNHIGPSPSKERVPDHSPVDAREYINRSSRRSSPSPHLVRRISSTRRDWLSTNLVAPTLDSDADEVVATPSRPPRRLHQKHHSGLEFGIATSQELESETGSVSSIMGKKKRHRDKIDGDDHALSYRAENLEHLKPFLNASTPAHKNGRVKDIARRSSAATPPSLSLKHKRRAASIAQEAERSASQDDSGYINRFSHPSHRSRDPTEIAVRIDKLNKMISQAPVTEIPKVADEISVLVKRLLNIQQPKPVLGPRKSDAAQPTSTRASAESKKRDLETFAADTPASGREDFRKKLKTLERSTEESRKSGTTERFLSRPMSAKRPLTSQAKLLVTSIRSPSSTPEMCAKFTAHEYSKANGKHNELVAQARGTTQGVRAKSNVRRNSEEVAPSLDLNSRTSSSESQDHESVFEQQVDIGPDEHEGLRHGEKANVRQDDGEGLSQQGSKDTAADATQNSEQERSQIDKVAKQLDSFHDKIPMTPMALREPLQPQSSPALLIDGKDKAVNHSAANSINDKWRADHEFLFSSVTKGNPEKKKVKKLSGPMADMPSRRSRRKMASEPPTESRLSTLGSPGGAVRQSSTADEFQNEDTDGVSTSAPLSSNHEVSKENITKQNSESKNHKREKNPDTQANALPSAKSIPRQDSFDKANLLFSQAIFAAHELSGGFASQSTSEATARPSPQSLLGTSSRGNRFSKLSKSPSSRSKTKSQTATDDQSANIPTDSPQTKPTRQVSFSTPCRRCGLTKGAACACGIEIRPPPPSQELKDANIISVDEDFSSFVIVPSSARSDQSKNLEPPTNSRKDSCRDTEAAANTSTAFQQEAQVVPNLAKNAFCHSTDVLETDKQSLKLYDTAENESEVQFSMQMAVMKAQEAFQDDLASPQRHDKPALGHDELTAPLEPNVSTPMQELRTMQARIDETSPVAVNSMKKRGLLDSVTRPVGALFGMVFGGSQEKTPLTRKSNLDTKTSEQEHLKKGGLYVEQLTDGEIEGYDDPIKAQKLGRKKGEMKPGTPYTLSEYGSPARSNRSFGPNSPDSQASKLETAASEDAEREQPPLSNHDFEHDAPFNSSLYHRDQQEPSMYSDEDSTSGTSDLDSEQNDAYQHNPRHRNGDKDLRKKEGSHQSRYRSAQSSQPPSNRTGRSPNASSENILRQGAQPVPSGQNAVRQALVDTQFIGETIDDATSFLGDWDMEKELRSMRSTQSARSEASPPKSSRSGSLSLKSAMRK